MPRDPRDFKVGADPEFTFSTRFGEPRAANHILKGGTTGPLGTDGHSFTAEVRPAAEYEPIDVVRDIRRLLYGRFGPQGAHCNLLMCAGSRFGTHPTGGHIHFGTGYVDPAWVTAMCKWLDIYVLPIVACIESRSEAVVRISGSYGRTGDAREQPHGMEWRPLASWLTSPYVALGVLALAKTVAWHAMYNTPRDADPPTLAAAGARPLVSLRAPSGLVDAISERNMTRLREHALLSMQKISAMDLFPRYNNEIGFLFQLLLHNKSWFPKCGMRAAWGIPGGVPFVSDKNPLKAKMIRLIEEAHRV